MFDRKIIAFTIPTMDSGGMERVMSEIVTYISEISHIECHLIIYGKSSGIDFYKIPSNVHVYRPDFKFNDSKRIWSTIKTSHFLRSMINKIKPDALLSFGEYWNNFVLLSLFGLKIPIYISERSSPQISLGIFHNFLRRSLYRRAAGIIVQTEKAKHIFEKKFQNKNIKIIGNPIRAININDGIIRENIIVSVGRLITTKNFNRLIDIFTRINKTDWKMIIIGGDSDKQNNSIGLQAQIERLGMSENIIMTGTKKNVEDYLLRAKIFAFTSSSEGFPNVIGEAMSAGLPVISYDCIAGPSDMIEDGKNGFLIPLFKDKLFEERLRYLMNNEEIREQMGIYAKESIIKFSVSNIGKQFYNFIIGGELAHIERE